MAAIPLISATSNLVCPHGGRVLLTDQNVRVLVSGVPTAFVGPATVSGCGFFKPCVRVVFSTGTVRTLALGRPLLTAGSSGLCEAADGTPNGPVLVVTSEGRVSGS
jgi:hypothetical protein